jgi:hypothetical protein
MGSHDLTCVVGKLANISIDLLWFNLLQLALGEQETKLRQTKQKTQHRKLKR